jgi:hypothetical protein
VNDKCGKDLAVSIRDRLLNLARERGEDFQLILNQYGLERLLYRLGNLTIGIFLSSRVRCYSCCGVTSPTAIHVMWTFWASAKAYPLETVVAEKYQALIYLGMANSRMKDYYDLWVIAREFKFDGPTLADAVRNTFSRRQTPLPEHIPLGFSPEFYEDAYKNTQWNAFVRKGMLAASPLTLKNVCLPLKAFPLPPTQALVRDEEFRANWEPGGPWR